MSKLRGHASLSNARQTTAPALRPLPDPGGDYRMASIPNPKTIPCGIGSLRAQKFPVRTFVAVVSAVCLGLLLSAAYSYLTLSRLRTQYMQNRAREIATAVDAQVRGPGRRNNPVSWQQALDEGLSNYQGSVEFMALADRNGRVLASAGENLERSWGVTETFLSLEGRRIFVSEYPLASPRQTPTGVYLSSAGWRLRLGLHASAADFIRAQAVIQVLVTGIAILTLALLAYYLLRTLASFVELRAREESEHHLRVLGGMAAALAHEIRNPLGAMKGLTQLAQEDLPPDHRTQELMNTVVSEAERLEKLVSDLLSFSRPRKPEVSEFELGALVREVRDMLLSQAGEKKVTVTVEPGAAPQVVRSDPSGLRQVLLNVVLNAVEAAPPGSEVLVRVRPDASARSVTVEVDDTGPGLQGRDPEELFQPFITSKTQGTGLGLAISRRIIESLEGTISLSDLPGAGARCVIRLPSRL